MSKFTSSIWRWSRDTTGSGPADPRALADLERRKAMGETRDLTGRLLGDPPAGRSALERKIAAAEARRLAELRVAELLGTTPTADQEIEG